MTPADFDELWKITRELVERNVRRTYDKQFDLYKHLTTLGAGSIVILVAFLNTPGGSVHKDNGVFLFVATLAMIVSVFMGYCGMAAVIGIQHSANRAMHRVFSLVQCIKRRDAESGPTGAAKMSVTDAETAVDAISGLQSAAKSLIVASWLNACLVFAGSAAFILGLAMLSVFLWKTVA